MYFHSLCTAVGLFASTASSPGQQPHHPPSAEERLSKLKTDLGLSEAQIQKIKPLLESNISKMKALHDDSSLSEEQRREKGREIRKAGGDAIMAELNSDQKAKFQEELKRHRKDGPPGAGQPPEAGGGPPRAGKGQVKGTAE
jgi:hypothetical protein